MGDTFSVLKRKSKPKFNKESKTRKKVSQQKVRVTSTRRGAAKRGRGKERTGPLKTRAKRTLYEDTINISNRYQAEDLPTATLSAIKAKKRAKKIAWGVFSGIFVTALVAVLVWIGFVLFFKVETVTCDGITMYDPEEIIAASGIAAGDSMFRIDRKNIEEALSANYPYLMNVNIVRELPTGIVIKAQEDRAAYYIALCGEYCILSEQLRVLEMVSDEDVVTARHKGIIELSLPRITGAIVGDEVVFLQPKNKAYITEVISALLQADEDIGEKIKSIDLSNQFNIKFEYDGRIQVLLGDNSHMAEKIQFALSIIDDFSEYATGKVSAENLDSGYALIDDPQGE